MAKIKKFLFTSLFTVLFVLILGLVNSRWGATEVLVITLVGIFVGRFLYSALFQVMINHKSIVIDENARLIQFTFQLGFSKHYILKSSFETNFSSEIDSLKVNELIYKNASRQSFKRLVLLGSVDKILISDGKLSLTLVSPKIINV